MTTAQSSNQETMIVLDAAAPMVQPRDLHHRLPSVVSGGVDVLLATAGAIEDFRTTMAVVSRWLEIDRTGAQNVRIARSTREIRMAKATGTTSIVIHFQGADPIEDKLDFLNVFQACGLRVMQLTYNLRNRLGDGCFEPTDAGLSKFGKKVLRRMEELSIAVDLAHAGTRTAFDALLAATKPVVVTHANARAICDSPRNLTDETIRAVAATGGVIGVCAFPYFITRTGAPSLDGLIDHIDHISRLVGTQHVGLGFDFADEDEEDYVYFGYDERYIPHPPWTWPQGIAGHAEVKNVGSALRARGFSEEETRGILGENFLRVFETIWGG